VIGTTLSCLEVNNSERKSRILGKMFANLITSINYKEIKSKHSLQYSGG